jgi:hypothetical protein
MVMIGIPRRHKSRSVEVGKTSKINKAVVSSQWKDGRVANEHQKAAQKRVDEKVGDKRWQHELKEMQETHDLDEVDDDVEKAATLLEWHAEEHEHRPKSPVWFAVLAAGTTLLVATMLFVFVNILGAITFAVVGGLIYYIAQQDPDIVRYRIMLDGVSFNKIIYHWEDLDAFNIIYEPDETKTVMLRSKRLFSPYLHMEIGDADPVQIREVLMEYVDEDQEIQEPMVDILARRLGF